jgi:thioredoxin-related protein
VRTVQPDAARRALLVRCGGVALGVLAAGVRAEARPEDTLPRIGDLREIAATIRRERIPLLLFFSTPGCPYCLEVRRNYLAPRLREDEGRLLIREVDITSRRGLVDLSGALISDSDFAARFKVRMTPVVQLVDADLKRLGRPLVGIDAAGFYEAYLAAAIEEAQRVAKKR